MHGGAYDRQRERYLRVRAAAVSAAADEQAAASAAASAVATARENRRCANMTEAEQVLADAAAYVSVQMGEGSRHAFPVWADADVPAVAARRRMLAEVQRITARAQPAFDEVLTLRSGTPVPPGVALVANGTYAGFARDSDYGSGYGSGYGGHAAVLCLAPVGCDASQPPYPASYVVALLPADACQAEEVCIRGRVNASWMEDGIAVHAHTVLPTPETTVAQIHTPSGAAIAEWVKGLDATVPPLVHLQAAVQAASDTSPVLNEGDRIQLSEGGWTMGVGRLYNAAGQRLLWGFLRTSASTVAEVEVHVRADGAYADTVYIPGAEEFVLAADFAPVDAGASAVLLQTFL
jgi:hypothetical protein